MSKSIYSYLFFCLFLFFIKILSIFITDFNLYGDEAQYWLWSKSLNLGYYSKPPLLSWLIALISSLIGESFVSLKLIPVLLYCFISYLVYFLTRKLYGDFYLATITGITFFLIPAVSFSSFLISTDILLIAFWTLGMIQVLTIKESPTKFNFFLLGFFIGMAFLAKYAAVYFLISLVLLVIISKNDFKEALKNKIGIMFFAMSFLIIISPNVVWNFNNGWITLFHVADNASLNRASINFFGGVSFLLSQIVMIGPIIFFVFFYYFKKFKKLSFQNKFLFCFWFPAFIIVLIESFIVRANANWAAVSLISLLILFVSCLYKFNTMALNINNYFNFLLGAFLFFLIGTTSDHKIFDRIRSIDKFAILVQTKNKNDLSNIVVGDRIIFANLSYEMRKKTDVKIYSPYEPGSKIYHHFQLKNPLPVNFDKNFVLIGDEHQIKYLKNSYTTKILYSDYVPFNNEKINIYEVVF